MKLSALFTCFFLCVFSAYSQDVWIANSTSDATAESMDVVLDNEGNSYITGYISGDAEFQDIQIDITTGYSEIIVAKIDPDGNYLWTKKFGGNQSDKGLKIALTSTNEIIITGTFFGSITFGTTELNSANNSKDIFLAKLTNNGDVIWARSDGGNLGDNVYGLSVDNQNNIITTGQFEGSATYGSQTFTSTINPDTDLPSFDIFLAKYDTNGNPLWAKSSQAEYDDRGLSVDCDNQNNIYLSGQFSDTINFFGLTIDNNINSAGFVSKFDAAGNRLWFDKLAAGQVIAYDIEVDNQQNIVVTGDFLGQLVVWANESLNLLSNPYSKKIFVVKLSPSGNYIWGRANGSESEVSSRTVTVDDLNNIYIGGYFRCNFDEYRDSTGTSHFQSAGFKDIFVSKFSPSGALLWKRQAGGQKEEACWGIDLKEADNPVITGSYATGLYFPFVWNSTVNITNIENQIYGDWSCSFNSFVSYVYVFGDESINFFTAKMISSNSSLYSYYHNTFGTEYGFEDSIPMRIYPDVDSVDFCKQFSDGAHLGTHTSYCLGPLYQGLWNNGTGALNYVDDNENDGLYIVNINRIDGCSSFSDSIYIDYHELPEIPDLTDDHNVNDSTNVYHNLEVCAPDTLNFWFTNLLPENTYSLRSHSPFISTPFNDDTLFSYSSSNIFSIEVTSAFGCVSGESFRYRQQLPFDSILLYLKLVDEFDNNDSIQICKNDPIFVWALDSISNPGGIFEKFQVPKANFSWMVTRNGNISDFITLNYDDLTDTVRVDIGPDSSGWYVVSYHVDLGYPNMMCFDTIGYNVIDSFYVDVKDNPQIELLGDELLCPDTYNILYITDSLTDIGWSHWDINFNDLGNSSILWTSSDGDSVQVNESGYYRVRGNFQYEEVACSAGDIVLITEKEPPLVFMDPIDGIICPQDSVLLSLSKQGLSYEWLGPEGFAISANDSVYGHVEGFYSCIFTDSSGCQLLTNQAEIREYTTPFLDFSPTNIICSNEPILLTAIHGGTAAINWHSPLSSNFDTITVNQAGTYACDVTQCGVTVTDSVTLIDGSFDLNIQASSVSICYGDTVSIHVNPGLNFYEWSNGTFNQSEISASEGGWYSVLAINNYGCTTTDSIEITVSIESFPPVISDTFVCQGGNIDLVYESEFDFGWYHHPNDASPFSGQDTVSLTALMSDTTLYIAHNSVNCPLNFTEVFVEALLPLTPPEIFGDTTVCEGEAAVFEVDPITNGSYFWVYDGDTISNIPTVTVPDITENSALVFHIAMEDGCTETENSIAFTVKFASPIAIDITSDTLCYGETLYATASGSGNVQFTWTDGSSTWNGPNLAVSYFDLYSDEVTVYGVNADDCRSEVLSLALTKSPDANLQLSMDTVTCLGNDLTLSAADSLGQITWTLPDGSSEESYELILESLAKSDQGLYIASFVNNYKCTVSDTLTVQVHNLPVFSFARDTILCSEDVFDLHLPDLDYNFVWHTGSTDSLFTPEGGAVALSAIDSNLCVFSDTVNVLLVDCSGQATNVITANNDGVNDYFTIFNAEYSYDNCIIILNRWGNVVYEQQYYRNSFNGNTAGGDKLSDGVYYFLYYKDCSLKKEITHQGYFHIISE
ncbi:MAG: hypothetical protein K0R65_1311 [Crocinitomicaceae bacterium]|jgi:gliding motility-associated-like protein|nr:hypothetical protein [Crocinitomicaceae bacterium]